MFKEYNLNYQTLNVDEVKKPNIIAIIIIPRIIKTIFIIPRLYIIILYHTLK